MSNSPRFFSLALLVATLGYFVDIYDLVLFIVLKNPSLAELGVHPNDTLSVGASLLNTQMLGMLAGGLFWGVLGDKIGRTKVLFGSIILYSLSNILNAFVHSIPSYHLYRALAGFGLAGELGAGVTLVAEVLPVALRGYGTTIIATVGISGAVVAGLTGEFLPWRTSYIVGGVLGLLLLVVRVSVAESKIFHSARQEGIARGSLKLLFCNRDRFIRYALCIIMGVPTWYIVGILMANAGPLSQALGVVDGTPKQTFCLVWCYLGLMVGDAVAGLLSQYFKSRKKPMALYLLACLVVPLWFLRTTGMTVTEMYLFYFILGLAGGYWILMLTSATEQFGTNIRATVTVTIPNFIRASVVPMSAAFLWLRESHDLITSAIYVGVSTSVIAFLCLIPLKETFSADLDFIER